MLHVDGWVASLHARAMSGKTVEAYVASVADFEKRMGAEDPARVDLQLLDRYMTRLALSGNSPATRRNRGNALKAFWRYLAARKIVPENIAAGLALPEKRRDAVSVLTTEEIEKVVFSFPGPVLRQGRKEPADWYARRVRRFTLAHSRDTAMLALAYSLGLRASEIGALNLADYSVNVKGLASVRLVDTKWAREPLVRRISARVQGLIEAFLAERVSYRVNHPALFPPFNRGRLPEMTGRGVSAMTVRNALERRVLLAGVEVRGRKIAPHILRYTICNHNRESGMHDRDNQFFMRHKSIETTYGYFRMASDEKLSGRAVHFLYWERRGRGRPSDAAPQSSTPASSMRRASFAPPRSA